MLGILIGLLLLMLLTYRGMSIIWVAPLAAMVVAITGGVDLLPAYTETYMKGFGGFAIKFFPMFALGAIFGKLMDVTGAAKSIAWHLSKLIGYKQALLAVVLICGLLTYGGISLFVVVFVMYPMGLALFREANITRRLLPGAIALGAFTFTMTALPGSPQIQNIIPMKPFGTDAMAAPVLGIVGALVMAVGGYLYLQYRAHRFKKMGEVFTEPEQKIQEITDKLPHFALSILPPLAVVLLFNIAKVDIIIALLGGVLTTIALFIPRLLPSKNLITMVNEGANSSLIAIINTSAAVGFGSVVRVVPGFEQLKELMLGTGGSPLISEAVAVNVLAGATGSASGGLGIALEALADKYTQLAQAANISPEVLHRVASIASGGLDTLPQNGAVLTLLAVTAMTHRKSYLDILVVCTLIPIAALAVVIALGSLGVV